MTNNDGEKNLLTMLPFRNRNYKVLETGKVKILVPKFSDIRWGKWIRTKLNHPDYHVNLDEFGSFVWLQCDGKTSVKIIGEGLVQKFDQEKEPIYDRLGMFLARLDKAKMIAFKEDNF